MTTAVEEKRTIRTGDEDDNNESWADLPLTEDEKAQIAESERDLKNGECLTLDEITQP